MANGLGPWWFHPAWRRGLTALSATFFDEANWQKHDEGYARGYPARAICDRKMLAACLRDASRTNTASRMLACTLLAWMFWALVRCFGWLSYSGHLD